MLGLSAPGDLADDAEVTRALAGRRAVLVLDNCEQLPDSALAVLPAWLQRLPTLHLLLTSRRTLALPEAAEWQPAPLACPPAAPEPAAGAGRAAKAVVEALARAPAVQLFVDRARACRADFQLHAGNAEAVAAITRLLGGVPLALELAAAQVRVWPPGRLAQQLAAPGAARWRLLARSGLADPAQRSLTAVVEGSLALLGPGARSLLQDLAVMPAAFAGLQAWHLSPQDVPSGAEPAALQQLVGASLLAAVGGDETDTWWRLPEPVRDLVAAALTAEQQAAAAQRWCHALQDWAEAALGPAWQLSSIEHSLPALTWVLDHPAVALLDKQALLAGFAPVWQERNPPAAALPVLDALLQPGPGQTPAGLPLKLHPLGVTANLAAGRADAARAHAVALRAGLAAPAQAARAEAGPAGQPACHTTSAPDAAGRVHALLALARLAWHGEADAAQARAHLAAAAAAARQCASPRPAADVLRLQGTLANEADADPAAAEAAYAQALRVLAAEPGQHAHLRRALHYNLAITAVYAGRGAQTYPALTALVEEARAAGDRQLLMKALNASGSALEDLGRADEAEAVTRAALAEAWAALETETALYALWNLAPMALARGDAARAARLMGFADAFWRAHFGPLAPTDARDVARLRRRCRQQLGRAAGQRCWQEGAALPLAAAMALAQG